MHRKFCRFFVTAMMIAVCCVGSAFADVAVNETNFPDTTFRNYVKANFDKDKNNFLSDAEISAAKSISINSTSMSSLKGIEYLKALTTLYCDSNALTTLDLSSLTDLEDVHCNYNQLTTLNVTGCTSLKNLCCQNNQIKALDVRGCTALKRLECDNNQLVSIDASGCTALEYLPCENNRLTTLNLSGCTALGILRCDENRLTELDISSCTALEILACGNNQLVNLDLTSNTELNSLTCYNNCLASLNIDNCGELNYLECQNQRIDHLNISDSDNPSYPYQLDLGDYMPSDRFTYVTDVKGIYGCKELSADYSGGNQFVGFRPSPDSMTYNYTLYVNGEVQMMDVTVYDGRLIPIDAENFPDEAFRSYVSSDWDGDKDGFLSYEERVLFNTDMNADDRGISSLKGVEYFSALTYLSFGNNNIVSVDLSRNTNLEGLYCYNNRLETLDVSSLTDLHYLECQNNKLTTLNLKGCTALSNLFCDNNRLAALDIRTCTAL